MNLRSAKQEEKEGFVDRYNIYLYGYEKKESDDRERSMKIGIFFSINLSFLGDDESK